MHKHWRQLGADSGYPLISLVTPYVNHGIEMCNNGISEQAGLSEYHASLLSLPLFFLVIPEKLISKLRSAEEIRVG